MSGEQHSIAAISYVNIKHCSYLLYWIVPFAWHTSKAGKYKSTGVLQRKGGYLWTSAIISRSMGA